MKEHWPRSVAVAFGKNSAKNIFLSLNIKLLSIYKLSCLIAEKD